MTVLPPAVGNTLRSRGKWSLPHPYRHHVMQHAECAVLYVEGGRIPSWPRHNWFLPWSMRFVYPILLPVRLVSVLPMLAVREEESLLLVKLTLFCASFHKKKNIPTLFLLFFQVGSMPLTWEKRITISIGLIRAIQYLHNFGILHGNVKR